MPIAHFLLWFIRVTPEGFGSQSMRIKVELFEVAAGKAMQYFRKYLAEVTAGRWRRVTQTSVFESAGERHEQRSDANTGRLLVQPPRDTSDYYPWPEVSRQQLE